MIPPGNNIDSLGRDRIVSVMKCVVNEHLIGTLPRFSLHIVHKAAAEYYDFGVIGDAGVPVPALDAVGRAEFQVLPVRPVRARHQFCYLGVAFVVLSADQVAVVVDAAEGGVFSGCWYPALAGNRTDIGVEGLTLLHALDVGLKTASQTLCELVPRYIVRWLRLELLRSVMIVALRRLQNLDVGLLPAGQ